MKPETQAYVFCPQLHPQPRPELLTFMVLTGEKVERRSHNAFTNHELCSYFSFEALVSCVLPSHHTLAVAMAELIGMSSLCFCLLSPLGEWVCLL
jgi:hypothetical protein